MQLPSVSKRLFDARKILWQLTHNRGDKEQMVVMVAGVQRSGTTMLMNVLAQFLGSRVHTENDQSVFRNYHLREPEVVKARLKSSLPHCHVFRVQFDAEKLQGYLEQFRPSKAIWVFRHFGDVVNSYMRMWPGGRNKVDNILADRSWDGWQARTITDETYRTMSECYSANMTDASAIALFWYFRNQMFFDQQLANNERVLPLNYEQFVANPTRYCKELADFIGAPFRQPVADVVFPTSVGKHSLPDIDPRILTLCEGMYERLIEAWKTRHGAFET